MIFLAQDFTFMPDYIYLYIYIYIYVPPRFMSVTHYGLYRLKILVNLSPPSLHVRTLCRNICIVVGSIKTSANKELLNFMCVNLFLL
uniref:Uncharacterized protein n=1 Tax=Octopus bimaculoides TaxID=37653 RepID=A0A0L8HKG4_OCTBM